MKSLSLYSFFGFGGAPWEYSGIFSVKAPQKKASKSKTCSLFQLNPPSAGEIHLRWMKSLRDEICLAAGDGGGFNFI
jgi:hypothetical protein